MFVEQLVERLLLMPEIRFSNPVICRFYLLGIKKVKSKKEKKAGNGKIIKTVNRKYDHYKILSMTGFEPMTSGIRSGQLSLHEHCPF